MAHITHFARKLIDKGDNEPESARLFRKIAGSEEARILIGDFFLRLAASAPPAAKTPHADLLRKMLGAKEIAGTSQLEHLARDFDLLREYDLAMSEKEKFIRKQARATEN